MSGPKPKALAVPVNGWVLPPPIDQAAASEAFGAQLADGTWGAIVAAFQQYGFGRDALGAAPRLNEDRNDPRSYPVARRRAEKKLSEALTLVREIANDRAMARAMCAAAIGRTGAARNDRDLERHLRAAEEPLHLALMIVSAADKNPPASTTATEADLRQRLARTIFRALADAGHDTALSGWLDDEAADSDLTPVERLLCAIEVPPGNRPSTEARWIREAIQ